MEWKRKKKGLTPIAIAAIGIAWMASGAAAAPLQNGPQNGPAVRFLPGDRFTSVAESPLGLLVDGVDPVLDQERLRALGERLSLVTWPEGTPVPGTAGTRAESATARYARVLFTPNAPPQDRWYLLRLNGLPDGFVMAGGTHSLPDGTWGVRFRTGPELILQAAHACRDKDGLVVWAGFSERVSAAPLPGALQVIQGGQPLACAFPPPGESARRAPQAKAGPEEGLAEVELHCAHAAADQPVDLALTRELRSIGGLAAGGPEESMIYHLHAPGEWQDKGSCEEVLP